MIEAIALTLLITAAPKTMLFGDLIMSYNHFDRSTAPRSDTSSFSLDQADLGILHYLDDRTTAYARLAASPTSVSVTEAYVSYDGLPWSGKITVGKFYKPLGAPVPLTTLSFPAIMFHANAEIGAKANFGVYPWTFEAGAVNGNRVTGSASSSSLVGASEVVTNITSDPERNKEKDYYTRIAYEGGESWGSLTAGVTGTFGELGTGEIVLLNPDAGGGPSPIGGFITQNGDDIRRRVSADLDFQRGPYRIFGEYLYSIDGRLHRTTLTAAGSYSFFTKWGEITPTFAWDSLDLNSQRTELRAARTWDRERFTPSVSYSPISSVKFIGQYSFNRENVRETGGGRVKNDDWTIQSIYYF